MVMKSVPGTSDLMRIYTIADDPGNDRELARARIPKPSFYLIRPDCHVGLAGIRYDAAAAARYLTGRVRLRINGA